MVGKKKKKKRIAPFQKKVGWVWRSCTEDDSAESHEGYNLLGSKGHCTPSPSDKLRSKFSAFSGVHFRGNSMVLSMYYDLICS